MTLLTSCWFQPIWKILVKLDHFPRGLPISGKWTWIEDVFPKKNGDIPASYVSLQVGNIYTSVPGNSAIVTFLGPGEFT